MGRTFAEANCSRCHAVGETGDSPYAPAPPFRTLSERYPIENLAEALAEGIGVTHGGDVQMPEFVLTPEEIDNLLAYLESLQG
jgi:cytochrome c